MIKFTVMYPATPGARFDHDYYRDQHMPLLARLMGDACKGYTIDMHTIRGCMNTLVDSGLVTEPSRGTFSRVAIKEAYKAPAEPKPIKEAKQPEKPMPKQGAIDKLTALSARVRTAMSAMKTLADDIDNAALEIEADIIKAGEGAQKYKQLQALLKVMS